MATFVWQSFSYDDVLILPGYSKTLPSEVDTTTQLTKKIPLRLPIMSAAMDTVTETSMAITLGKEWWIWILHKNMSWEQQTAMVTEIKKSWVLAWAAIGAGEKGIKQASALLEAWVDVLVLDSAHGHSKGIIDTLIAIKKLHPTAQVIAGNIATGKAAKDLVEAWADAVKVGIWPWSICTTRIVSWVGRPQFSAVLEVSEAIKWSWVPVIADGWIKHSWDAVKALVAWASCVMLGSALAGTDESPGDVHEDSTWTKYKIYRGMWSIEAMKKWSADRYSQEATKKLVPEGIVWKTPYKWSITDIIFQYVWWIRSWMWYCWAETIDKMREQSYTQMTWAWYRESHPHSITISHDAPNYKK